MIRKTAMNFDPRLYVEIVPLENGRPPQPHPILQGRFDASYAYKVLGMYNPSETSECYLMLANPRREIWFIPQRHTRAWKLLDGDAFFVLKSDIESDAATSGAITHRLIRPSPGHRSPAP